MIWTKNKLARNLTYFGGNQKVLEQRFHNSFSFSGRLRTFLFENSTKSNFLFLYVHLRIFNKNVLNRPEKLENYCENLINSIAQLLIEGVFK